MSELFLRATGNVKPVGLPEFPRAFPNDPYAEKKIRDGVGGDRVTEPAFPANQALIREAREQARQPFAMLDSEDDRGDQKRAQ